MQFYVFSFCLYHPDKVPCLSHAFLLSLLIYILFLIACFLFCSANSIKFSKTFALIHLQDNLANSEVLLKRIEIEVIAELLKSTRNSCKNHKKIILQRNYLVFNFSNLSSWIFYFINCIFPPHEILVSLRDCKKTTLFQNSESK